MTKVADVYKVTTTRPLEALDKVGIAELAQYVEIDATAKYPIASAYASVSRSFMFEIERDHDLHYVDFNSARAVFKDGSTLTFSK